MAISVASIQEGCCDSDLSQFTIIDGDALDSVGATCDKIIECHDKYILIEEKSLLMAFFDLCCNEVGQDLENYKYDNESNLRIDNVISLVNSLNIEVKKRILSDTIVSMISTSAKKASNTTDILNKQFDNTKTNDMPVFYLYCNSGKPIDRVMSNWLSRNRKNLFIECQDLKQRLTQRPCQ
ncbi:MAG: hypothetical protein ACI9RG_000653 [Sulfurimonas sp.]